MKLSVLSSAEAYHDTAMEAMEAFRMAKRDKNMDIARKAIDVAEYLESVSLDKIKSHGGLDQSATIIGNSLAAIRATKEEVKP